MIYFNPIFFLGSPFLGRNENIIYHFKIIKLEPTLNIKEPTLNYKNESKY